MIIFSDKNYSSFLLKIVFSQNIYKNNLNITSYFFLRLITSIKKKLNTQTCYTVRNFLLLQFIIK